MKTSTKTVFASALAAIILTSSALTTFAANHDTKPAVNSMMAYNKVQVNGNVKIILVQADKQEVKAGENFDPSTTSIRQQGQTLVISSTESAPVTVTVSVKDLQRIDASGNASVVTRGQFEVKYLQIFLNDNASAQVKANTESLYTLIKGQSDLRLSGSAQNHTFMADQTATADLDNFVTRGQETLTAESIAAISNSRAIVAKIK